MIALRQPSIDAAEGPRIVESPEDLCIIHHASCPAVIWHRQPLTGFQQWIDGLDPARLPRVRTTLRPDAVPYAVEHLCADAGLADDRECARLIGDVSAMAQIFAEVMAADYLAMRLEVVTSNACRKFHIDALRARLICTYRGTGTQYGSAPEDGDPYQIHTVPTGAPMILRGTEWPVRPACGFVHRSPPIEGTGETRLVLVLDPVESLDPPINQHRH
jgi:hypothetical protein